MADYTPPPPPVVPRWLIGIGAAALFILVGLVMVALLSRAFERDRAEVVATPTNDVLTERIQSQQMVATPTNDVLTERIQSQQMGATPTTVAAVPAEPALAWEECRPFARDYHAASRRMALGLALRRSEVAIAARTLEFLRREIEVEWVQAELGEKWAKDTFAFQDELSTMTAILVDDMPGQCDGEYPERWAEVGASMESPTYERCDELANIAREALPEDRGYMYVFEMLDVMDKLENKSSVIDTDVAYEVLGELVYADHLQLQEGAKASLISLCDSAEWKKAAQELAAAGPR